MTSHTPTGPTDATKGVPVDVAGALATLPVTRLVHFTPAMNLFSIIWELKNTRAASGRMKSTVLVSE